MRGVIRTGDCVEVMRGIRADSVDAIVCDPPYGLEFMGKDWDNLGWQAGGGFSKPGIGDRPTEWTSFSSTSRFGAANPTCATCGGRLRGAKRCSCDAPDWKPIGKRRNAENEGLPDDMTGGGMSRQMSAMQDWHYRWAVEALRVAKPGAFLLAFGGTRTVHRLAAAIEDAGWEIRDMLMWGYASGFPKSLDVSKALDKAAGAKPIDLGASPNWRESKRDREKDGGIEVRGENAGRLTAPATDDARAWQGWGTALKPAWEPIVMARKPLRGTVAQNVLQYGTGALNIDGTRIGTEGESFSVPQSDPRKRGGVVGSDLGISGAGIGDFQKAQRESIERTQTFGRWPANVVLTDPVLDGGWEGVEGGGSQRSGVPGTIRGGVNTGAAYGAESRKPGSPMVGFGDEGGYSRFFLVPKASRRDREPDPGLLPEREPPGWSNGDANPGSFQRVQTAARQNTHPTVKPTALMRHLVRLVTPKGGVVLDPFAGSGSTLLAAEREGFAWVGIEREPEYVAIAEARLGIVR